MDEIADCSKKIGLVPPILDECTYFRMDKHFSSNIMDVKSFITRPLKITPALPEENENKKQSVSTCLPFGGHCDLNAQPDLSNLGLCSPSLDQVMVVKCNLKYNFKT